MSGVKPIYLRTAREKKGLTQEQLEQETDRRGAKVSQARISALERDSAARAEFETVITLADVLEVNPRALRFGPDPKNQERASA